MEFWRENGLLVLLSAEFSNLQMEMFSTWRNTRKEKNSFKVVTFGKMEMNSLDNGDTANVREGSVKSLSHSFSSYFITESFNRFEISFRTEITIQQ